MLPLWSQRSMGHAAQNREGDYDRRHGEPIEGADAAQLYVLPFLTEANRDPFHRCTCLILLGLLLIAAPIHGHPECI